jgi:hypothetical protein
VIDLDGAWDFQYDPNGNLTPADLGAMRATQVPGPWQSQFDDLRLKSGVAWYRRAFTVPEEWRGGFAILRFGAVDYHAEVWLNGARLGEHEGGYLPFTFEVQDQLRLGDANELLVRVIDVGLDTHDRYPEFQFTDIPEGKQNWYGPIGGIWQSVQIELHNGSYLRPLRLTPDPARQQVEVDFEIAHPEPRTNARIQIAAPDGRIVATVILPVLPMEQTYAITMTVRKPIFWDLESPALYRCTVEVFRESTVISVASDRFGFRTIETRDGSILLNGRPIFLRGALDQDYYPETIYTPPSESFLRDRFVKAKELGLNCLRCHIKVPDPLYYALADELGLLVWTELPSWGARQQAAAGYAPRSEIATERALATLAGIIRRDWNHPSIICWSIVNENWGTRLVSSATDRAWLRGTYDWVKALDPNRLVVDNSPCAPNFHVKSDLDDYHFYYSIPDHAFQWTATVDSFASRPAWSFSPHGDVDRTGDEPLIVSEFGNWGLPNVDRMLGVGGAEPWWFATGGNWGRGITRGLVYPHGVRERFDALDLASVFGSYEEFTRASQESEHAALAFEIGEMRRHESIKGYVITELTDVHWECNGLLEFDNGTKSFHDSFAQINSDDMIIPTIGAPGRRSYWEGETIWVSLAVSHYSQRNLDGATVSWQIEPVSDERNDDSDSFWPSGCLTGLRLKSASVTPLEGLAFAAPSADRPIATRLRVHLTDATGARVASNTLDLSFYPRSAGRAVPNRSVGIVGGGRVADSLTTHLRSLGYETGREPCDADVVIALGLDQRAIELLEHGQRVLVAGESAAISNDLKWKVVERDGTGFNGDWASNFNWVNPRLLHHRVPSGPRLDWAFSSVTPDRVIYGLTPEELARDGLVSLFLGWIQKPVGLAVQFRSGKGVGVMTTLHLIEPKGLPTGEDPTATVLLGDLIEYLASGRCEPEQSLAWDVPWIPEPTLVP